MVAMDEKELYSALGRLRSSKRRVTQRGCEVCGVPMLGIAKKKYCSRRCLVRAYRQRRRELEATNSPPASEPATTPRGMPTGGRSRRREGS